MKRRIVAVVGPTATGKTRLGVSLARRFSGEIVSADSRQVYRGLDIGSGKDLSEYQEGGAPISYHLVNVAEPEEIYNLKRFYEEASRAIEGICGRGMLPIVVGGSGLYLDALFKSYLLPGLPPDSELRVRHGGSSSEELCMVLKSMNQTAYDRVGELRSRPRLVRAIENAGLPATGTTLGEVCREWLILGIFYHRSEVHRRIERRLDQRLANGMIDEVQALHDQGVPWERLDFFGLEYRYVSYYLRGEMGIEQMRAALLAKIRRLARSQDIWFRKMEREGIVIHWLPEGSFERASCLVESFLCGAPLPAPEIRIEKIRYGPKSNRPRLDSVPLKA